MAYSVSVEVAFRASGVSLEPNLRTSGVLLQFPMLLLGVHTDSFTSKLSWYVAYNNNNNNNNNNNIYLLQLGCHPVVVVLLHVNKT